MKPLDTLAQALLSALPSSMQTLDTDIPSRFKAILEKAFTDMGLLTREEFDIQSKVLERTREKLTALEIQVKALAEAAKQK